jgi:hypothetical protein
MTSVTFIERAICQTACYFDETQVPKFCSRKEQHTNHDGNTTTLNHAFYSLFAFLLIVVSGTDLDQALWTTYHVRDVKLAFAKIDVIFGDVISSE